VAQSLIGKGSKGAFPLDIDSEARMGRSVLMLRSGDKRVREGSTMPAKRTGIGSWITGNSAGVLQGVDCGDPSRVMMSSALRVQEGGCK
jgi:hypothetical protein